jgi:hypothetical protein
MIFFFEWGIFEPIARVIVVILIILSGWRVVKDSILYDDFGIEHRTIQIENEDAGYPSHHGTCN